jgi:hypothetical protein
MWIVSAVRVQSLAPLGRRALFYLAAAVSDFYIPVEEMAVHKIQSGDGPLTLSMQQVRKPGWLLCVPLRIQNVLKSARGEKWAANSTSAFITKCTKGCRPLFSACGTPDWAITDAKLLEVESRGDSLLFSGQNVGFPPAAFLGIGPPHHDAVDLRSWPRPAASSIRAEKCACWAARESGGAPKLRSACV